MKIILLGNAFMAAKYSKQEVRRAGDYLSSLEDIPEDRTKMHDAFDVIIDWRASHAYPMNSMLSGFRRSALSIDNNALVVQRLKRGSSIISKLHRQKNMRLDRMEDIGGCRIIVSDLSSVERLYAQLKERKSINIIHRERDYLSNPRTTGYRGLHLIYKYNGSKKDLKGRYIELQIRTKLQHTWATAVEVLGTFTSQDLKSGLGREDILDFFKLASMAFSDLENDQLHSIESCNKRKELQELAASLDIFSFFSTLSISRRYLNEHLREGSDYVDGCFLLTLDTDKSEVTFIRYLKEENELAVEMYGEHERKYREDPSKTVVLLFASSLLELEKSYPNYFGDSQEFTDKLKLVLADI